MTARILERAHESELNKARRAAASGKPTLNPVLRPFWELPGRNKVLYGGRSSSKSWDAAGVAIFIAANYETKFLCTRQFQNKIEESVYSLLITQIDRFGMNNEFRILKNKIIHRRTGSEFLFYGLWRHIDEIKSLEGVDVCWIEEAHNLMENQWRVLRDTVRKNGSQFWIIFNPRLATDFVYRRFVVDPPPRTVVRKINYDENPFLPETALEGIQEIKEEDEDEYRHVFLGYPKEDDEEAIIKRRWIEAAIDAHEHLDLLPTGSSRVGFDPADDGPDMNALAGVSDGWILKCLEEWKGGQDRLGESCSRVYAYARHLKAHVVYDNIGVGAHCGSEFKRLNGKKKPTQCTSYAGWNAGGSVWRPDRKYKPAEVKNKDFFLNAKAQAWWLLADRFRQTYLAVKEGRALDEDQAVSISSNVPHLEKLIQELSTPRKDYNANGKVMVESKKDLAKRDVPSPNLAEAFVMAFAPGVQPRRSVKEEL